MSRRAIQCSTYQPERQDKLQAPGPFWNSVPGCEVVQQRRQAQQCQCLSPAWKPCIRCFDGLSHPSPASWRAAQERTQPAAVPSLCFPAGTPMTALRNSFSPARCDRHLTVGCAGALRSVCHTSATHSGKTNTAIFLPTAVKLPRPARCTACVEALALWPQPKSLHIGSTTEADSCTLVLCMSGVCSLW